MSNAEQQPPVPQDENQLIAERRAKLAEWRKMNVMPPAPSRLASIHPLRHELDLTILEALGFSRGEASAIVGRLYESYAR